MAISPTSEIIDELKRGRMVVLLDDEDRENEGDLLVAAEYATPEHVNFMARFGRGLICLTLTQEHCRQLRLPLMVSDSHLRRSTNFTVSIDAAHDITTGISAADRAATIRAAIQPDVKPSDLITPGHIFPLMAQHGGVLARAGHTEAGVDLARLAQLTPASVICEILNEDGTMARLPELVEFARTHQLKVGTIADLIRYRMENESSVQRMSECRLPTDFGEFRAMAYHDDINGTAHLALVKGEISRERPVLVRVHVQDSLLDLVTGAHRAGSAWSLRAALARVAQEEAGVVVILQQPEPAEALIRRVQRLGDRRQSAESSAVGDRQEMRTYGLGSQILADIGVGRMRVLGHAMKAPGLSGFGLEITEYIEELDEAPSDRRTSDANKTKKGR